MINLLTTVFSTLALVAGTLMMLTCFNSTSILMEWEIMYSTCVKINLPILIDHSSMTFLSTVLVITASVMQFSKSYMADEKHLSRFLIMVTCFVLSMILLIFIPNMITLLIGWDGLGITSFILVIYYQNPKSLGAGMITALSNRVGDVMLLLSIGLTVNQGHWYITNMWYNSLSPLVIMMITLASMTKSAQIPFSSWLPAAMAAPTPVSSLVHSSTLVTAGVYLLYRFFPFLSQFYMFNTFLLIISALTMLMAGCTAMAECDMKKIIALSTLSQLGVMMFSLAASLPQLAFFHLVTHALFKALLFICAGNMISNHHHSQDLRMMGATSSQMPVTCTIMSTANMALCGMPFMAGFFSKDLIIESFMMSSKNTLIALILITATILTTAYSTRFSMYLMFLPANSPSHQYTFESLLQMSSLPALMLGTITGGAAMNWLMFDTTMDLPLSLTSKLMPLSLILTGLFIGFSVSVTNNKTYKSTLFFNSSMWLLTPISTHMIINPLLSMPLSQLKLNDHGWNELPNMPLTTLVNTTFMNSSIQNNLLTKQMYMISMIMMMFIIAS